MTTFLLDFYFLEQNVEMYSNNHMTHCLLKASKGLLTEEKDI